ncbi:methyl-accepting chemotaxis protein [Geobacter sp. DSM 9736]|uniref:methyl-accepting chemotaxis protein n=1 Tax=Geobacter sp. DSM 9736 TaxID=1277350 RepID=UPI000B504682|nr:HAMP domain-containing methyl-accepting chemotaxis protein [Geobacter sp. DSM 9736]SNB46524.1 Methyl-accepting chemotaxis protein [Geobacter sp. DSM 9736]
MLKATLSQKFILQVLLVLFLGQFVILFSSYRHDKGEMEEGTRQKALLSAKLLSTTSATALSTFDFTYLGMVMDEVVKDEDVSEVSLHDANNIQVFKKKNPVASLKTGIIELPVRSGVDVVGKLVLRYSLDPSMEKVFHHLITTLVLQIVVFVVLGLLIYYFFNRDVGRRISVISGCLDRITEGDLTQRVQFRQQDEISLIANGLNFLVERLASNISRIKSLSGSVASTSIRLTGNFQAVEERLIRQHESTEQISMAVQDASASQIHIIENSNSLLDLSNENTLSLSEIGGASAEIAVEVDSLNVNAATYQKTVVELGLSARNVAVVAAKASRAVEDASSSVESASTSVREIETVVKESSELSAHTTRVISEKGMGAVSEVMTSMHRIEHLVDALTSSISRLGNKSKDIAGIVLVIRQITDQTKLLALNASIIAAQAGEHGKSFAVVANEMKNFSDRTADFTRDIEDIIISIQHEIGSAVQETKQTSEIVHEGGRVAAKAGGALEEILESSRRSTEMVERIEQATADQSRSLEQILMAIRELQKVNAALNDATVDQEAGTARLIEGIGTINEAIEKTRRATEEQASTIDSIVGNLGVANEKTAEIVSASSEQQAVNDAIRSSLEQVVQVNVSTLAELRGASAAITEISDEIGLLHKEIKMFRTVEDAVPNPSAV